MTIEPYSAEREWTVEGIPVLTADSVSSPPGTGKGVAPDAAVLSASMPPLPRYCEKWLLPQAETEYREALAASAPLPCFRAELNYCITYQDDRFLSLYTYSREVTVPGPPLVTRRGDTWDLASGYPVPLSAWFPQSRSWKRRLLDFAAEEIRAQERAGVARYREAGPGNCAAALTRRTTI